MKSISRWARQHVSFAIFLIILFEVANAFNGLIIGATLLDNTPAVGLQVGVTGVVVSIVGIRWLYRVGSADYWFRRGCLFGAFLGNFLLFGLVGGLMAPRLQPQTGPTSAWGNRRIESRSDTLVRPDTLRPVSPSTMAANTGPDQRQTGKRIGFILLFVLSLFLMYGSTGLACGLLCSGYGFWAAVVFLLGLGFLAGGIFFLGRLQEKPIKKLSQMSPDQRRRTGRRFWRAWGLLIGIFVLLALIGAIF